MSKQDIYGAYNFIMDSNYWIYLLIISFLYFIVMYIIDKKVYDNDKDKRKSTRRDVRILVLLYYIYVGLVSFSMDIWFLYLIGMISGTILLFNIGNWYIFKKYSSIGEKPKIIREDNEPELYSVIFQYIESKSLEEKINFVFDNETFNYRKKLLWKVSFTDDANKNTRMYGMFLSLAIFFIDLGIIAYLLDGIITSESLLYGVFLFFGAVFLLPYLKDMKYTIRFVMNKHLAFHKFVSIWHKGEKVFGEIIDMNVFEIILKDHFTDVIITISHDEIKIFTTYENSKMFTYLYIISKDIKYVFDDKIFKWLEEFNQKYYDEEIGGDILDLESSMCFFTTESYDHGFELNIFINLNYLFQFTLHIKRLIDFIQRKADDLGYNLGTPIRIDYTNVELKEGSYLPERKS